MAINVVCHDTRWVSAVRAFNDRLADQGSKWGFYPDPIPAWLPKSENAEIFREFFLAVDGEVVRGGYALKTQPFFIGGTRTLVSAVQGPVTEGAVNRSSGGIVYHLLRDMHQRQPLLFGWGMGGSDRILPQLLPRVGWAMSQYSWCQFVTLNSGRLSKRLPIETLRLESFGFSSSTLLPEPLPEINASEVPDFGNWSDVIWNNCCRDYAFVGQRTSSILRSLYPRENSSYLRLRIDRCDQPIGWAVLVIREMQDDEIFGNAIVAYLWDCMAAVRECDNVIASVFAYCGSKGCDLILSCLSEENWVSSINRNGGRAYIDRQRVFGTSPALSALLESSQNVFLSDGDADGPIGFFGKKMGLAPGGSH
ncbi:hypothetical protein SH528x_003841 [Novipirellula sp. SH528]|uniref:hypothetical protein n=1 Tax=Novipirellula sp. SH528 TaxID=3454466 RepID=UPI003FA021F5